MNKRAFQEDTSTKSMAVSGGHQTLLMQTLMGCHSVHWSSRRTEPRGDKAASLGEFFNPSSTKLTDFEEEVSQVETSMIKIPITMYLKTTTRKLKERRRI